MRPDGMRIPLGIRFCLFALPALVLGGLPSRGCAAIQTEVERINYQILTRGLEHPWSLAFLPDGRMLVSERPGHLRLLAPGGTLDPRPIEGLPPIHQYGQGGLLDLALHPDFVHNRLLYFSYAERGPRGYGTAVARGVLDGDRVVHEERMLKDELGRIRDMRQGPDGLLYLLTDAEDGMLVRLVPAEGP
jgi:glucose/arabinose dehydrogenase